MLTSVSRLKRTRRSQKPASQGLILIGLFKLVKALLLIMVGIGALRLLHKDIAHTITHWVDVLRVDPDNRFIHGIIARAFDVTPAKLKELSVGTFFYAGLLLTEGTGLLLRKHWAEYFTVIVTGSFIPLEIYELIRRATFAKVTVLLLNVAVVVYLAINLRRDRG